jgi:2-polyprenyl-3-methyl-5-hydroxy-6-metoxy-1,4-benzoquinol methylase
MTPAYREEQERLHGLPNGYGGRGRKWAADVHEIAGLYRCASILDYGCGQGSLAVALAGLGWADVREYDPAVPGKDELPAPADLVVCTDVLEHIEPACIWNVMEHLKSVTKQACFMVVSLVETAKTLSDGRQAHILLRPQPWWQAQFEAHGFVVGREFNRKPQKQWAALLVRR